MFPCGEALVRRYENRRDAAYLLGGDGQFAVDLRLGLCTPVAPMPTRRDALAVVSFGGQVRSPLLELIFNRFRFWNYILNLFCVRYSGALIL